MIEWRDIPGYEGLYQASSEGRIRSLDRVTFGRNGSTRIVRGKVLNLRRNPKNGYIQSVLSVNGQARYLYNHRLVCLAFHGSPEQVDDEVCHFDNNRMNNRPSNLRWDTRTGNHADKKRHGTSHAGKKLTMTQAREIRRLNQTGQTIRELAAEFRVSESNIAQVLRNIIWKESA